MDWLSVLSPLQIAECRKMVSMRHRGYGKKNSREFVRAMATNDRTNNKGKEMTKSDLATSQKNHEKDLKKLLKESTNFSREIYRFIGWMDAEMKRPSTDERGKRLARAINGLEMFADKFSHFTLNQSFETISKIKKKGEKHAMKPLMSGQA